MRGTRYPQRVTKPNAAGKKRKMIATECSVHWRLVGHRRYVAERNKMFVNLARIKQLVDDTPGLSYETVSIINAAIYPDLQEQVETLRPHRTYLEEIDAESTVNAEPESTVDLEQELMTLS